MAETSWPGPGPAVVDEHMFELLSSAYHQTGLVGGAATEPLLFADGTGMHVKLRPDRRAVVLGQMWASDGDGVQLDISANASGSTRVDRVTLRLDRSTWVVAGHVIEGTPGAGAPAVTLDLGDTGEYDLWVGDVTIPSGTVTITAGMVAAKTGFLGSQMLVAAEAAVPMVNVPDVFLRYDPTSGRLVLHTDGAVAAGTRMLHYDTGWISVPGTVAGWTISVETRVRRYGGIVWARIGRLVRTGATVPAGVEVRLPGSLTSAFRIPNWDGYSGAIPHSHCAIGDTGGRGQIAWYPPNHSERGNEIWVVRHSGISSGTDLSGSAVTWIVGG